MALSLASPDRIPESRLANRAEAAEWFGVSQQTIANWLSRGCPYIQQGAPGKSWVFDLLALAKWRYGSQEPSDSNPEDMTPKDRLDWYRGEAERLKLEEQKGDMIQAGRVRELWEAHIRTAKGRLLALPSRLSPSIFRAKDMRSIEVKLTTEIRDVMEELANGPISDSG